MYDPVTALKLDIPVSREPVVVFNTAEEDSNAPTLRFADAEKVFNGPKLADPANPDSTLLRRVSKPTSLIYNSDPEMFRPPEYGCNSAVELPELNIIEPESSVVNFVIYPY